MSENKSSSKKSKAPIAKSRVVIEGEGRDEWGNRYFKFLVVGSDHDIPPISVEQLLNDPKPLFTALGNAGWNAFIPKVRNQLLGKLQKRKPKASSFEVVTRLGWNSGAFVLADKVVGHPKKRLEKALGDLDQAMLQKYRAKGTLKQWQEKIAVPCSGNSRLMFAVSLAFTGPILPFVRGPRAGGFQIWGPAETGKTTAAMVAGSVWGCHRREGRREKGFAESWNSTKNKIEVTALAHNHTLLILDETKGAGGSDRQRAEVVTLVVFGLAECTEKERLTNATPARSWRCYFLSTSNLSLAQLGRRGKVAIDEAHLGRLADIPLPSNGRGIYEKLHGFADGERLSDVLQRRSRKYCGTAGKKFAQKLVDEKRADPQRLQNFLKEERAAYREALASALQPEDPHPLNRNTGRFATTFAAGSLAIKFGILPWGRRSLLRAILSCQLDGLRHASKDDEGIEPSVADLLAKLAQYLKAHHSEFMYLNKKRPLKGTDKIDSVPGYRAKVNGTRWYYLTAGQLEGVIGTGPNANSVKHRLANEGLLDRPKNKNKFVVQRRIFRGGKGNKNYAWVHAIDAAILKKYTLETTGSQ